MESVVKEFANFIEKSADIEIPNATLHSSLHESHLLYRVRSFVLFKAVISSIAL